VAEVHSTQKCRKCKNEWPLEAFSVNRRRKSGYDTICRTCKSEYMQGYSQTDRGREVKKRATVRTLQRDAGYGKTNLQKYHLRRTYGIDVADYDRMFRSQGGVCLICNEPETALLRGKVRSLAVDHCHTSGKIRGLLCNACNNLLRCAKDDEATLLSAVEYLRRQAT
jgi:hypothetical protein